MSRAVRPISPRAPRRISFVRFCVDVLHLELTDAWRVLLAVTVDGVQPRDLPETDRSIAATLFGSVDEVPADARRILVWRLGRGSGKSTIAAALAVFYMVTAPATWGPGQQPSAVVVAPSKDTAAISVTIARELVRGSSLEPLVIAKTDSKESFSLRRPDGRVVTFKAVAASRGGSRLRGFDILVLVLDESEFFLSNADAADGSGYSVSDRDLVAAAMPRLLGACLLISTPWPSENMTAEVFEQNFGAPATACAALGASVFMRPSDARLAKDVARETERDPENADREYRCVSAAAGSQHIFVEGLAEAIDRDRSLVVAAPPGSHVGAGADVALERDSSAIAIASMKDGAFTVLEVDEIRPSKGAPLAPGHVVRDRFAPVLRRHGVNALTADAHYRQSIIEHLTPAGLSFVDAPTGAEGKYESFMFVRGLLRSGQLKLPNSPRLIAQMRAVLATPMPGGRTRITSPRRAGSSGGHGDLVSAVVCAIWSAKQGTTNEARRIGYARRIFAMTKYAYGGEPGIVFDPVAGEPVTQQEFAWRVQERRIAANPSERAVIERGGQVARDAAEWDALCQGIGNGRTGRDVGGASIAEIVRRIK